MSANIDLFLYLFQAEYEIAPDEKLGEKGKEVMMKYLTPEVRGSQRGITEGMLHTFAKGGCYRLCKPDS